MCFLKEDRGVKRSTAGKYFTGVAAVLSSIGCDVDFSALPILKNYRKAWSRGESGYAGPIKEKKVATLAEVEELVDNKAIPA